MEEAKSGKDQNENLLEQMTQGSQSSSLVLSGAQCDNQIPSQEETKAKKLWKPNAIDYIKCNKDIKISYYYFAIS